MIKKKKRSVFCVARIATIVGDTLRRLQNWRGEKNCKRQVGYNKVGNGERTSTV
jgi:hypothetical protein